jgi:AraC family transcriptional activator of tynA and feaB
MEFNASRSLEVLDLARLRPDRRAGVWADTIYEKYYPLDIVFPHKLFEWGRITISDVAGLRIGRFEAAGPFVIHRRHNHISCHSGDYYVVQIPAHQSLTLRQRGREAVICPGDFAVNATSEPYCYEQPTRNDLLGIRISGPMLRERIGDIDDFTALTFSKTEPAVALFIDFARSLFAYGTALEPGDAESSTRVLLDLMAIAIRAPREGAASCESSVRLAHRQRALKLIDARLSDNRLTPSFVAKALGLSNRYLQQIFADRDESLSSIIRTRRVEEAKRLLREMGSTRRTVSSIAYAVGFSDPAYFSRVFLSQTDLSPTAYRAKF